jgi:hypothetical protein
MVGEGASQVQLGLLKQRQQPAAEVGKADANDHATV